MTSSKEIILLCYHCGNETSHSLLFDHSADLMFEEINGRRYLEPFDTFGYVCGTCSGLTLLGGFRFELLEKPVDGYPRLFPPGPDLLPPRHMLEGADVVPLKIEQAYRKSWPLRFRHPGAFVGQMRRTLELVCKDQGARGATLQQMLNDLSHRKVLPGSAEDMSFLIKLAGNIASHADERETDYWDAELVDSLFRIIIESLYVAPARVQRLRKRLT